MGWEMDKYFRNYKADVKRDDLQMFFMRLYTDGRDMMSDCLKPSWEPVDDFVITIISTKTWDEVKQDGDFTITRHHVEELDRLEVRTKDKKVANYFWYMAAKMGVSYEQIKAWALQVA